MSDAEQLETKIAELSGEAAALAAVMTKEDLRGKVDQWLEIARAHAAGSSRFVLGGQASGDNLAQVLFEDLLADEGLSGRIVARLEAQGFGELTDRQRDGKLKKLENAIAHTNAELREARKAEALAAVEAEFGGVAA
jgi:hypothetical protein